MSTLKSALCLGEKLIKTWRMEFSIGPAYIWMIICVGLLLVIIVLSCLICFVCHSHKKKKKEVVEVAVSRSTKLAVHQVEDLEKEEEALALVRPLATSFSTFTPNPIPSDKNKRRTEIPESSTFPDFQELRTSSARGACTSAPSLILAGSFR